MKKHLNAVHTTVQAWAEVRGVIVPLTIVAFVSIELPTVTN